VLAEAAPELARLLMERALATDDVRTLAVIAINVFDRVLGKPTERPQSFEEPPTTLDTAYLSKVEAADALACCERLAAYLALVEERRCGGGGIETQL
jgi:hypothetical protein